MSQSQSQSGLYCRCFNFYQYPTELQLQQKVYCVIIPSLGYFKSVEKFIKASEEQLEFETQDELKETPLMVAIRAGMSNIETIQVIIELGGRIQRAFSAHVI